jgi:hypothetical protein
MSGAFCVSGQVKNLTTLITLITRIVTDQKSKNCGPQAPRLRTRIYGHRRAGYPRLICGTGTPVSSLMTSFTDLLSGKPLDFPPESGGKV